MAKTFLRSGNLDAVLALGENGQPVYASALQIRETLRLRRQTVLANCLAIPQPNARGDRLDWYAPFSGKVKSWLGASDRERRQALEQLTATQQEMQDLSARARDAENPAMRLFGALLSKALQFPDQQYVYLVDGKPVITFWGFVDAQSRTRDDALACLRDTLEASLPPLLPEVTVTAPQPAMAEMPLMVAEPVPVPEPVADAVPVAATPPVAPAAAPAVAPVTKRRAFRLWYLTPVALAVAGAAAFWLHQPVQVAAPQLAAPAATAIAPPAALVAAQKLAATLPQTPASVAAPAETAAPSATLASVVTPAVPAAGDALKMSVEDVRTGAINVVDGRWRVVMQNSLPGGASPVLHYEIRGGKGSATVTQGNNLRCSADEVSAAMLGSGQLSVRSRYTAKCSDGSRYRMPQLMCKPGDGAAVCEALFSDDKSFPMTIKRESK
ncbi:SrfA family protein [Pantoea sp. ACRSH]|uniref:SrfA family protein n=1 Tax=unclassified Pantoea TaxID=2630326 RepID=UPI001EF719FE|nr:MULTISPECIES: SrfA family protein [unclassified Pantoea]MCG7366600.1 SrfA family protein [Pantoea sp. ACRSH]MCG7397138.1 SrfA family protein [Pantoea sp. ACRSC]